MDTIIRRPFFKWEPNEPDSTQDGQEHFFDIIVESNIPFSQEKKYLCGLSFSEEPSIDLFVFLDVIEPFYRKEILEKNKCSICFQKLKDMYPKLDKL